MPNVFQRRYVHVSTKQDKDSTLYYLAAWARAVVEIALLYQTGEGRAMLPDRKTLGGKFNAIHKVKKKLVSSIRLPNLRVYPG